MTPFQTALTEVPGTGMFRLQVEGIVTFDQAPELRQTVVNAVCRAKGSPLVVDLANLDQIDTAGVAVLLEGLLLARKQNVKYFLCAPSESVLRVFRLARLGEALDCCCRGPEEVEQRLKSSAGPE